MYARLSHVVYGRCEHFANGTISYRNEISKMVCVLFGTTRSRNLRVHFGDIVYGSLDTIEYTFCQRIFPCFPFRRTAIKTSFVFDYTLFKRTKNSHSRHVLQFIQRTLTGATQTTRQMESLFYAFRYFDIFNAYLPSSPPLVAFERLYHRERRPLPAVYRVWPGILSVTHARTPCIRTIIIVAALTAANGRQTGRPVSRRHRRRRPPWDSRGRIPRRQTVSAAATVDPHPPRTNTARERTVFRVEFPLNRPSAPHTVDL